MGCLFLQRAAGAPCHSWYFPFAEHSATLGLCPCRKETSTTLQRQQGQTVRALHSTFCVPCSLEHRRTSKSLGVTGPNSIPVGRGPHNQSFPHHGRNPFSSPAPRGDGSSRRERKAERRGTHGHGHGDYRIPQSPLLFRLRAECTRESKAPQVPLTRLRNQVPKTHVWCL